MNDNLILYAFLEKKQVYSNSIMYFLIVRLLIVDEIVHYSDSHHIAVYHKGRWFKVSMFYQNHLLEPCELQMYIYIFFFYFTFLFLEDF